MPDEATTNAGTNDAGSGTNMPPEGQAPPAQQTPPPANSIDSLPDWAKKELTDTRAEAANYRTKLRDAEQKLSTAKSPEDIEAAVKEFRENNAKLERDLALANASKGLSDEQAAILAAMSWQTPEDLTKHVEAIRKLTPAKEDDDLTPPGKPRGGLNPGDEPDTFDPHDVATKLRQGLL